MLSLKKLFHGAFGEIGAIVSDNVVRKTKAKDPLFHELNRSGHITLIDWLCLNPLLEFINRHQEVRLFIFGPIESPTMSSPQTASGQVIGIILNS